MRIQKLILQNFRGVKAMELQLHPQLNVLAGINGSGKSTLIDASAILLSWLVNRIKTPTASGRPISDSDIRNSEAWSNLTMTCTNADQDFSCNIVKFRKGHSRRDLTSNLSALTEQARRISENLGQMSGSFDLPVFAYYPVNRAVLDIPFRIRSRHTFERLSAYDDALSSGANFRTFFEWFREREDLENEVLRYQRLDEPAQTAAYPDPQLEAVRQAIRQFMPDVSDLGIRRNPVRMELVKNNQRVTVSQLSDGEKCLMALVGDLARRMAIANPHLENPLASEGIVLIDEIDLHLHPKWQRMVLPQLQATFPRCQFLISTHSPSVITHVPAESLFLLHVDETGIAVEQAHESYGKTANQVLEDLMGLEFTRPASVAQAINQLYDLISANQFKKANLLIEQLKKQIGEDPDLVRAKVLIKRKEVIGK